MSGLIELSAPTFDENGDAHMAWGSNGLHLCGAACLNKSDYAQAYTAWWKSFSPAEARNVFGLLKPVGECLKGEQDFIMDLIIGGDVVEDFYTNRQMIAPMARALAHHLSEAVQ